MDKKILLNGCGNPNSLPHSVVLGILEMMFSQRLTTVGPFLPDLCGEPNPQWHISCYGSTKSPEREEQFDPKRKVANRP